jgi:hypothetical protein
VHRQHPLHGVDLRIRHARGEPETPHRNAVRPGALDHLVARSARWVGVVEHPAAAAGCQSGVERRDEIGQRAAALIAVQSLVAPGRELGSGGRLPRPGHSHHQHDLALGGSTGATHRTRQAEHPARESRIQTLALVRRQLEGTHASARAGVLDARRAGNRRYQWMQVAEPRQRDVRRRDLVCGRDLREERITRQSPHPIAAERTVDNQADAVVATVLGNAVAQALIVEHAQAHLYRRDLDDLARRLDLADGDVAESDLAHRTLLRERGERTHAGGDRRLRIDGMELIAIDRLDTQRATAGIARGTEMLRATIGDPLRPHATEPALGGDLDRGPVARPRCERARDEPLVMPDVVLAERVRVGRVEKRRADVERGVDDRDPIRLVPIGTGGEAHAAEADHVRKRRRRRRARECSTRRRRQLGPRARSARVWRDFLQDHVADE